MTKPLPLHQAIHVLIAVGISMQANAQANLKLGSYALYNNTSGVYNTAIGTRALYSNTTGNGNTALGYYSLYKNVNGFDNTASGVNSLFSNTSGERNAAYGRDALRYNTSGSGNTAVGFRSLQSNTFAWDNVALGAYALESNTTGGSNTATGFGALSDNISGSNNTATGNDALHYNTVGSQNTANGNGALYFNTSGEQNTAVGHYAMLQTSNGNRNTAIGFQSLAFNTSGNFNTASGYKSLQNNTTGFNNTAIGSNALLKTTTGSNNTAIGDSAGAVYNSSFSTFVGFQAGASSNLKNVTALGYKAVATASNQVRIGNTSVTSIAGKVGWTTLSDGRFKKDMNEEVPGLSFITRLRPVNYSLDLEAIEKSISSGEGQNSNQMLKNSEAINQRHTGFVAQEVEKLSKELNFDFGGVDKPQNDQDHYGLRYAEFVVPLVKAVQELAMRDSVNVHEIIDLKEQNNLLKNELVELKKLMLELKAGMSGNSGRGSIAYLEQNRPNPFNGNTTIRYYVPTDIASASVNITDSKGTLVKTFNINKGEGTLNINGAALPSGTYNCTLLVDGKQVDSRKMVIVK